MTENVKKLEDLTLQDLRKRARFDMFIVLKPGITSWLPGRRRSWCYRGDKFTDIESRMIASLVRMLISKIHFYQVIEIYDNDYHFQNERRIILKISAGTVEKNLLEKYSKALTRIQMPDYLKP